MWGGGGSCESVKTVRSRWETCGLRVESRIGRHDGRPSKMWEESGVEGGRVKWLVSEGVSWRRVRYLFTAYLKNDIPCGLSCSTPERLAVTETYYDVRR